MPGKKTDIKRANDYFRRAKDKSGDISLIARGLLHFVKYLEFETGRDVTRAKQLLDRAFQQRGIAVNRKIAEAMFLLTRELSKK